MKIAITITDFGAAAHIGGDPERETHVIDIPDLYVPCAVKREYRLRREIDTYNNDPENVKHDRRKSYYSTVALSVVEPPKEDE